MQNIQTAIAMFTSIIGKQSIDTSKEYRFLNYILEVKYADNINLLYNNLTKEFLVFDDNELKLIKNKNLDCDLVCELIKKWFLVPTDHNDSLLRQQVLQFAKQISDKKNITNYTILPTTACNARCFYCFEAGTVPLTMTEKTALEVGKFISEHCGDNKVKISWFGGEPLCNKKAISIIINYLKENNITFLSSIVTNGFLFDLETINEAKDTWNLKHAQITLDGMKDTYNKVKNYVSKHPNPFEQVIKNIGYLLSNEIAVTVRLNMDRHNSDELYKLVDYLYSMYGNYEKFNIYAQLLFENMGFVKTIRTNDERIAIEEEFRKLRTYIDKLGVWGKQKKLSRNIKTCFCMADSYNSVVIAPSGKIGRCEHFVDSDFIGDINSKFVPNPWNEYRKPISKCSTCPCFPTCLRLENCPDFNTNCYDFDQEGKIFNLKKQMVNTYEHYLSKNNS